MTTTATGTPRHATGLVPRRALFGFLLAAAVILGLLLMHAVHLGGILPAHAGAPASGAALQASTDQQHLDIAPAQVQCEDCDRTAHHELLAGGCVLALLVVLLVLDGRTASYFGGAGPARAGPAFAGSPGRLPRPPSLHALGILRT